MDMDSPQQCLPRKYAGICEWLLVFVGWTKVTVPLRCPVLVEASTDGRETRPPGERQTFQRGQEVDTNKSKNVG